MTTPRVLSVGTALPPHRIAQDAARSLARSLFADMPDRSFERFAAVFDNVHIDHRNVCAPPEWFAAEHSFTERNDLYQHWATELGEQAACAALDAAGVDAADVGSIIFVSTTGLATPSLDVRLMTRLGLPARHTHRQAVFGRGCSGGAIGLALAADRCRLDPTRPVLLIVVELCSLTYRRLDLSTANVVSSALFADGAAAVVMADGELRSVGDDGGVDVLGHDGITWPDTEDLMGWRFGEDGLTVTLARSIPALVRREFRRSFDDACDHIGVPPGDVRHHLVHPGSSVVLDAITDALDLEGAALDLSRAVLRAHGNMSAATVLFILQRFLAEGHGRPGELAILSAMGPGFSADHVALRC